MLARSAGVLGCHPTRRNLSLSDAFALAIKSAFLRSHSVRSLVSDQMMCTGRAVTLASRPRRRASSERFIGLPYVSAWIALWHPREDEEVVVMRNAGRKQLPHFRAARLAVPEHQGATRPWPAPLTFKAAYTFCKFHAALTAGSKMT